MTAPQFLFDGPARAPITIALAHGAGAPMDSPFMWAFAEGLAKEGFRVARFEFPYMTERRTSGRKRPPDRADILLDCWRAVIAALKPGNLAIGGKSLGGRMASMVADEAGVRGLVCLGYPFHPPGRPPGHAPGKPATPERLAHLADLKTPTLICQGERDALGSRDEVESYKLSPAVRVHWLADGDHGYKPRRASGLSEADNWRAAIAAVVDFAGGL
ncbi:MAG: alpha/beta family hydrolase [Rhodospirillales bacterium]